jgi:inorganic pyrophosphatase
MVHFFETYKKIQNKEVSIGSWHGAAKAKEAFEKSCAAYLKGTTE